MDDEKKNVVSPQTSVFFAASVGKVFTAVATMQLVEQGKINLDENVNTYLKGFFRSDVMTRIQSRLDTY